MANQSSDLRKRGPRTTKAVASKTAMNPLVHASGHKTAKRPKAAKVKGLGAAFLITQRRHRTELVISEAKKAGLVGGPKNTVIRGRVSDSLVKAAKKRAGVKSDTELLEVALSSLALEDDFGEQLLKLKGSIDPDIDLEF